MLHIHILLMCYWRLFILAISSVDILNSLLLKRFYWLKTNIICRHAHTHTDTDMLCNLSLIVNIRIFRFRLIESSFYRNLLTSTKKFGCSVLQNWSKITLKCYIIPVNRPLISDWTVTTNLSNRRTQQRPLRAVRFHKPITCDTARSNMKITPVLELVGITDLVRLDFSRQ